VNRYRVTVSVTETRTAEKQATFDVEAEDEDGAKSEAQDQGNDHVSFSADDFDHEDTNVFVRTVEFIGGDDPPEDAPPPRCDKTIDMFQGA
jgi:hypothetical protein